MQMISQEDYVAGIVWTFSIVHTEICDSGFYVSRDGAVCDCGPAADGLLRGSQSVEGVAGDQV